APRLSGAFTFSPLLWAAFWRYQLPCLQALQLLLSIRRFFESCVELVMIMLKPGAGPRHHMRKVMHPCFESGEEQLETILLLNQQFLKGDCAAVVQTHFQSG